jgi:hypothetical protein
MDRIPTVAGYRLQIFSAVFFGVALATTPTLVLADVQVRGSPQNVRVEARDTSLDEILASMDSALNVHHRSAAKLDKRLNGTYEGSLHSVIKRILEGYDFFVKTGGGETEVTVIAPSAASLGTAAPFSLRISNRPIEAGPAQLPPAPAAAEALPAALAAQPPPALATAEPRTASSSPAVIPAQPLPAPAAAEPHRRSTSAAPSFRRRHRDHFLAGETGSLPTAPRKIRVAGGGRHKSSSHFRSMSFADKIFCCSRSSTFGLEMTVRTRPGSWPRWEDSRYAVGILFDPPRWWPRRHRRRFSGRWSRSRRLQTWIESAPSGTARPFWSATATI